jgi:aspartate oxidase
VFNVRRLGVGFTLPLRAYAASLGVNFAEDVLITRLLVEDGVVVGAVGLGGDGQPYAFPARSTILACGGLGHIFLNTNNAAGITGDGYALAYDVGASLADMEFVQFYPTALGKRGGRTLLYEALVFRAGAVIKNSLGEDITERYGLKDPATMTRDRVSRAVMQEIVEGRGVALDLSPIPPEHLESLRFLLPARTPPQKRQFPVSPTTHHAMGGVRIDTEAHTEVEGLFAAGEVCAGMHGANRLAGNAITEIWVMGAIAGRVAAERAKRMAATPLAEPQAGVEVERLEGLGSSSGTATV